MTPSDTAGQTTDYDDDIALMVKAIASLNDRVDKLASIHAVTIEEFTAFKRRVEAMAEYQGVKHLLGPQ